MEKKEGNNKIKNIIIIILSILVIALAFFIVKDKLFGNLNTIINDNKKDNKLTGNTEEIKDDNQTTTNDNDNEILSNNDVTIDYSDLFDMGNGLTIASTTGKKYYLTIASTGEVKYSDNATGNSGVLNINNAVDVVYHRFASAYAGEQTGEFFILTKDGYLYSITEEKMALGNFELIKNKIEKIIRIGTYGTSKPNAGGGWGAYAITSDGKAHSLAFDSV